MFTLSPNTARIPDVAVVETDRLSQIPDEDIAVPIAPDLAIEIISPSESAPECEKKVREYLAAGVQEVWQIYPDMGFVRVRRPKRMEDFERGQIPTSPVLPNFEIAVDRFFAD